MNPIGFNILAMTVNDVNTLIQWITDAQPAACVVMEDSGLAQRIRQASPQTTVIYRTIAADENEWRDASHTPELWLANHKPLANNGVILQVFNEPISPSDQELPASTDWLRRLMNLAAEQNVTLALPTFAVGNPGNLDQIVNGGYDDLLRALAGSRHILLLHEYFRDDPESGEENPWLIGRFKFWLERAATLGIQPPTIIIGEHGRDFGGKRGPDGDGWKPRMSEDEYFTRLVKAQSVYRKHNIPVCIFSYGHGFNNDWVTFDIEHASSLKAKLIEYGRANSMTRITPVVIEDEHEEILRSEAERGESGVVADAECGPVEPRPVLFRVVSQVRIRGAAGLDAVILNQVLNAGDEIEVDPGSCTSKDDYVWWKHSLGWSAERTARGAANPEILMQRIPREEQQQSILLPNGRRLKQTRFFEQQPVMLDETAWIQYFGNTTFAFNLSAERDPDRRKLYYFSQGLHAGIDYGNNALPDVRAGVHGVIQSISRNSRVYAPNFVKVQVDTEEGAKYTVIYGHVHNIPEGFQKGDPVQPGTKIAEIAPAGAQGPAHLHLEVDNPASGPSWIINPLLFMPDAMWLALTEKFSNYDFHFHKDATWTQWLTPLDQPVLRLSRPEDAAIIGPLAARG